MPGKAVTQWTPPSFRRYHIILLGDRENATYPIQGTWLILFVLALLMRITCANADKYETTHQYNYSHITCN